MSGRRFAWIVGLALLVVFIAANLVSNTWLRGARIDLTSQRVYSISPGTRQVLAQLTDPVDLTLYFSQDAATRVPELQAYGVRVRELLQTYEAVSDGKVRVRVVDPIPSTDAEIEAQTAGLEALQNREGGGALYLGLVGRNAVRDTLALPSLSPAREPSLEYEITRVVAELDQPAGFKVALITGLPLDPEALAAGFQDPRQREVAGFSTALGRSAEVEKLGPDFTEIPADTDVLAIIHPFALSPAQLYAIDQHMLQKGRAFIAVDPLSLVSLDAARQVYDPSQAPPVPDSNLAPILEAWGVRVSPEAVIDVGYAERVGPGPRDILPIFYTVPASSFSRGEILSTLYSRGIRFGAAGAIDITPVNGIQTAALIRSSPETQRLPAQQLMGAGDPASLLSGFVSSGQAQVLAARVSGTLRSAFANGPPPGSPPNPGHLSQSVGDGQVVVISDSDFLTDVLSQDQAGGGGQLDNLGFALNALDILRGDEALVSLRARGPALNRLTVVDEVRNRAAVRSAATVERLQSELASTQERLRTLQAQSTDGPLVGDPRAGLSPAQRAEVARFEDSVEQINTELRRIQRSADVELSGLRGILVFLHVWMMPLLVIGAGLVVYWWHQRRRPKTSHADQEDPPKPGSDQPEPVAEPDANLTQRGTA